MELIFGHNGIELVHESGNWNLKSGIGFSPVQMTAVSVGACGMYVFDAILKNSSIPCEIHKVDVSYTVDEESRVKPITSVTLIYNVSVSDEYKDKVERIIKLVPKSCPVMQSLDPRIEIIETLVYQ